MKLSASTKIFQDNRSEVSVCLTARALIGRYKHGYDVLDSRVFLRIFYFNRDLFPRLHSLSKGLGVQRIRGSYATLGYVSGLHNCLEFCAMIPPRV